MMEEAAQASSESPLGSSPPTKKIKMLRHSSERESMVPSIQLNLSGNLGERHRYLNTSVLNAYQQNAQLYSNPDNSEDFAIERLFKIDLASKQRNVDYILHTLKDDDMLYVSRGLKSLWLFEPKHSDIINPSFLEHELFTHMTLQAVNKVRHWIQMHLRDPVRCSEFYLFYKDKDFNTAAKFLWNCSNEYILGEVTNVLDKITPQHLKILSEKVPLVTKIYYVNLRHNQSTLKYYLENDYIFFNNMKFILKFDPDVFFYVIENFFVCGKFSSFSAKVTNHILKHHKNRFMMKPELYTVWFLNMNALAKCLKPEEAKDLVIKLAKAQFLESWFSYKQVEPLLKRLDVKEKTALKQLVFVDKAYGQTVEKWPYPIPVPPKLVVPKAGLFLDPESPNSDDYTCYCMDDSDGPSNTPLDRLFNQYRFTGFRKALFEIRKQLKVESSPQHRQHMLLVLVSKTGGRPENLASLLELLLQYKNEPLYVRAAVVRSLVKRSFAWRLAPEQWFHLLNFGHGLGLNGELCEATCNEGLDAVVIRDLLANVTPNEIVWKAFLDKSTTSFTEYSLSSDERSCIRTRLPTMLLAEAQSNPEVALNRLRFLLDTLSACHLRFDEFPGTVEAIMTAAKTDFESAKGLLTCLYKSRVARKQLIKENFEMIQTDASYINVLRHNISILENTEKFEEHIGKKGWNHERFFRKLTIYFSEKNGLRERYRALLEIRAGTTHDKILARPLALLIGSSSPQLCNLFDTTTPKTPQRHLAAALRSNAHVVRPSLDLEPHDWRNVGAKAITNRVATCRQNDVERYFIRTLSWSRTSRLALMLAKRLNKEYQAYEVFATKRPGAALKAALKYFQREGDKLDLRIWHVVKPHISKYDKLMCHYSITNVRDKPAVIKSEYCVLVYRAFRLSSKETALCILRHIVKLLHEVDDQFIIEEIEGFLRGICTEEMFLQKTNDRYEDCYLYYYVEMIAKYLLLSTSEEMFEERFHKFGMPFFKHMKMLWSSKHVGLREKVKSGLWDSYVSSLKYNHAFFDLKYDACLYVFEKSTEWMQTILPIEKWFGQHLRLHFLMIYCKSVRHCLKQSPELFSNKVKPKESVYLLGTTFGTLIADDVEQMTRKHFPSIAELYAKKLNIFLLEYVHCVKYDESIENFTKALLNGILSTNESAPAYVLARSVFLWSRLDCNDERINNSFKSFQKSQNKELLFRSRINNDIYS